MAKEKQEKTTLEMIGETRNYFKRNENGNLVKTENYDNSISKRVYGVKTLQAYIQEIEKLRNDKGAIVEETYLKNGEEIDLNSLLSGSGLSSMLALLSKEIKSAEITRYYDISTGGFIEKQIVKYKIELY